MDQANADPRSRLFALEQIGIKLGLEQIRGLVTALGHPDRAFPSIVVAGTNGKGSTTAMIERGLRAAGYRTGRYTSPHLVHLEERFAVNGIAATTDAVDDSAARVLEASTRLPAPPSFFEATTAIALDLFCRAVVEVAVLEVGLGGRLDATNVVTPTGVVITSIDLDHEQYLGNTITAIAAEKAGVIKPGAVVVLAKNPPAAERIVAEACVRAGTRLIRAEEGVTLDVEMRDGRATVHLATPSRAYGPLSLALRGRHQVENALATIRLLEALSDAGSFHLAESAIRTAVEDVEWPARLEIVERHGLQVLIDGAHNPAGARALAAFVRDTYGRPLPLVVGIMRDKHVDLVIAALADVAAEFIFTSPSTSRAASLDSLEAAARRVAPGVPARIAAQPLDAVHLAARRGSPVVVAGSLYLAGEVRAGLS